jgi:tRNA (guanine37-N1)-methyltransferase
MKIDVLTLFPDFFTGPLAQSMMRKANEHGHVQFEVHNLRNWGIGPHRKVDDTPFGGGAGMVLRPEPLFAAFGELAGTQSRRIFLTPHGTTFTQPVAQRLSMETHLVLLAGHYEGIDQRVRDELIDEEISIGDYVLTGGELPALVVIDSVVRLVPGVLGDERSHQEESFSDQLSGGLEYPHYTQPASFTTPDGKELMVPEVLRSGHHAAIEKWRRDESAKLTIERRPDLSQD